MKEHKSTIHKLLSLALALSLVASLQLGATLSAFAENVTIIGLLLIVVLAGGAGMLVAQRKRREY